MTAYRIDSPSFEPPAGRRKRPVGAKVLMILGLVLLVGAAVVFTTGTHRVLDGGQRLQERAERLRRELVVEIAVPGRAEVRLGRGRYNIYDIDRRARLGESTTPFPATSTTVPPVVTDGPTGPDGRPTPGEPGSTTVPGTLDFDPLDAVVTVTDSTGYAVPQTPPALSSFVDAVGGNLVVQHELFIERSGTYTVEATGVGGGKVGIGRAGSSTGVGRVVGGAFLTLAGVLLGGLGGLAFLVGLIWLLVADTSPEPPLSGGYPGMGWPPPPGGQNRGAVPAVWPPGVGITHPPPGPGAGWPSPAPETRPPPPVGGAWTPPAPANPPPPGDA